MTYELSTEAGYIHLAIQGHLALPDLMEIGRIAYGIERTAEVTPHRLTDLSRVTDLSLNFMAMEQFAATRRTVTLRNNVRSAIVAPTPLLFGFARMFQTLNTNPQIEVVVFNRCDEAIPWILGQTPTERLMPRCA